MGQECGKCFPNKLIQIIPRVKSDLKRSPGDPREGEANELRVSLRKEY